MTERRVPIDILRARHGFPPLPDGAGAALVPEPRARRPVLSPIVSVLGLLVLTALAGVGAFLAFTHLPPVSTIGAVVVLDLFVLGAVLEHSRRPHGYWFDCLPLIWSAVWLTLVVVAAGLVALA